MLKESLALNEKISLHIWLPDAQNKITAKSSMDGGQSGDTNSPHFKDQALMYTKGQIKAVLYYPEVIIILSVNTIRVNKKLFKSIEIFN